ncbi:MAG: glucuronate isomerase [Firmicutes bacterium]|nr:glucuronate isomerase [Bacillota bacterium]
MKFLDDKLYLETKTARKLYDEYAKGLPVVDYHSHLNADDILSDRQYKNIAELWLSGDHYKWRLMRACGADENYITGSADGREKFCAFARILPLCAGNPVYTWCNMELKKYFGYTGEINEDTANGIFELSEKVLAQKDMSVRGILERSGVETLCTTDDPADGLTAHAALRSAYKNVRVLPTFRPDKALNIGAESFRGYAQTLGGGAFKAFLEALEKRLVYFAGNGCVVSDHALPEYVFESCTENEAGAIFGKRMNGESVTALEQEKYKTFVLMVLARLYCEHNIAMQLHFNCSRNNNAEMFGGLGPDTGFDSIGRSSDPRKLAVFLNALDERGYLPKTIVYSLDPGDNRLIHSVINCFQGAGKGKLQHGAAWWFNDTKTGIREHLRDLAEYGALGNFIGMLTDSRSFTSYVRHDYFRRLLCGFVGDLVESGEYPNHPETLKQLIDGICYHNVKEYLGL